MIFRAPDSGFSSSFCEDVNFLLPVRCFCLVACVPLRHPLLRSTPRPPILRFVEADFARLAPVGRRMGGEEVGGEEKGTPLQIRLALAV